jgi:hypothetical protein
MTEDLRSALHGHDTTKNELTGHWDSSSPCTGRERSGPRPIRQMEHETATRGDELSSHGLRG